MIILGLDPGLASCGYGVIRYTGSQFKLIDFGVIKTKAKEDEPRRLKQIYSALTALFQNHPISQVGIEKLFFNTNTKTAMSVAQARGICLLVSELHNCPTFSYTPPQIKSGVCGYGSADKQQVQFMVKTLLNMKHTPKPDDAADALAVAINHAHASKLSTLATKLNAYT